MKVVDKATGEVIETNYESFEDFANQYHQTQERIKALGRLLKKMNEELKVMMADEPELQTNNGYKFVKYTSQYKNYDPAIALKYFDIEDLQTVLTISKSKMDSFLKEHATDGGKYARATKELRDTMTSVRTTETLRLEKASA